MSAPSIAEHARHHFSNVDLASLGPAGHHAAEDAPEAIAREIATWMDRRAL